MSPSQPGIVTLVSEPEPAPVPGSRTRSTRTENHPMGRNHIIRSRRPRPAQIVTRIGAVNNSPRDLRLLGVDSVVGLLPSAPTLLVTIPRRQGHN